MAKSPDRVVWDACSFIAYIKQEKIEQDGVTEDRFAMCGAVLGHAKAGGLEIVTSTLALAEVRKAGDHPDWDTTNKVARFLDQPFLLLVPLDPRIGRKARELALQFALKPQDAVYLATAAQLDIPTLHCFDKKLLAADGKAVTTQGLPIRVCKPEPPSLADAPLFEGGMTNLGAWA